MKLNYFKGFLFIKNVENIAKTLRICFDAGAKQILLPMINSVNIVFVSLELFAKFQIMFYSTAENAVFKALGVQ